MGIVNKARAGARKLLGPRLSRLLRQSFREKLGSIAEYRSHLASKHGIEIGGPSPSFTGSGEFPIYDVLGSLDNCLYSESTIWTGETRQQVGGSYRYHPAKPPGRLIIADATDLRPIANDSYECLLACHCLEHIANPLRALREWKRVLKENGMLLLILPHRDGTFDWRRPPTPLSHMIEDDKNATTEEDVTHLPEILELHDLSKDQEAGTPGQFRERCLANYVTRAMHHHVFDTMTALATVDCAGFKILRVDDLKPCHIIILAERSDQEVDNQSFLRPQANHLKRSPFPSDRKLSSG
jgi:SAM-dependent methyltransferase